MKTSYIVTTLVSLFLFLQSAGAENLWSMQVTEAKSVGVFANGIGSQVELQNSEGETHDGLFLGQLLNHNGDVNSIMTLDMTTSTVNYIPTIKLNQVPSGLQNVLKLYEQQGGTCTGYAIDDFLLQTNFSGFVGNSSLKSDTSTEEGRTALLADAINQYYLVLQHQFSILGILKGYGKKYGFSCAQKIFTDAPAAQDYLINSLVNGMPVLLSFTVSTRMTNGPFTLTQVGQDKNDDQRLWLPRKLGERNGGGHSVLATGSFRVGDKKYLVMLDSDWNMPRVWDMDVALGSRAAIGEVEFYSCQ